MTGFFFRLTWAAIALACVASPAAGQGRPLGIDDVLSMEAFGVASISPDGERAVYERRGPYDSAPRYDLGHRSVWAVTDLFVVDLEGKGVPHRLLPRERDGGLLLGPWSPTGRRLLVYRLAGDGLEAGIADPQAGTVGWTGLTPDMPFSGAHAAWLDDDRLVLTIRPGGSLPWMLRHDGASQSERTRQWALMADGDRPSRTVVDTAGGVASAQTPPRPLQLVEIRAAAPSTQPRTLWEGEILDVAGAPEPRGRRARWTPSSVFNDGRRTFIAFDAGLEVDEAPVLFVLTPDGEAQMVNYRQQGGLFVVDRLFDRAELRLGDRRPQVVRLVRLAGAGR